MSFYINYNKTSLFTRDQSIQFLVGQIRDLNELMGGEWVAWPMGGHCYAPCHGHAEPVLLDQVSF